MKRASIILIADDEPDGREVMAALLRSPDYEMAFAGDGQEVLDQAQAVQPDLILLDVMMPVMDGFEVCRRLRADPVLAEVPVIIVTALGDQQARIKGIEVGADDFISKPYNRLELRARVKAVTRLNRFRRLQLERAKFEWVVEQADDGYVILNGQDAVVYANPQARLYLDLPDGGGDFAEGDLKFIQTVKGHYHLEPMEAWVTWPDEIPPNAATPPRYLVRPETASADARWLQVKVLETAVGAEPGRIVRLRDISTQIKSRNDVWTFHSSVSHKLRTSPAVMTSSLQLLEMHIDQLSKEEIKAFADSALKGAKRLRDEIEDVVQFLNVRTLARPGEGFALEALPPLVNEVAAEMGDMNVAISVAPELAQARLALSHQATEILLRELLENAKKFHPRQRPTVEVSVKQGPGTTASLRVSDNGVTLSGEQLAKVWTPYYQIEKHFTGEAPGMGLGLASVAFLIGGVGGTSRMTNRPDGPGITVELIVPLAWAA